MGAFMISVIRYLTDRNRRVETFHIPRVQSFIFQNAILNSFGIFIDVTLINGQYKFTIFCAYLILLSTNNNTFVRARAYVHLHLCV